MSSGMSVATPNVVYAWPKTKEEFDKIAINEMVHEWKECETTTVIKNDGCKWERRCHSKHIQGEIDVIFQWFDERKVSA